MRKKSYRMPPPAPARRPPSWAATCAPPTTGWDHSPAPARTSACSSIYGTNLADLTTYFKNVGQTNNVPITLLSTDGTSTSCSYPKLR